MPTYDYQCRSCGHTIEVIHSMLEDGPTTCEQCGGQLRRVFHPTGIIFRGSGFYKTDSRSSGSASVASGTTKPSKPGSDGGSSSGTGSGTGSAETSKGDAKPSGSAGSSASD